MGIIILKSIIFKIDYLNEDYTNWGEKKITYGKKYITIASIRTCKSEALKLRKY